MYAPEVKDLWSYILIVVIELYAFFVLQDDKSIEDLVEVLAHLDSKLKSNETEKSKEELDLFGEPAMNNAMNICHNIQVNKWMVN